MLLVPTFFTMALAGIWHGAGSQFLIFGLLHAAYLSINHAWRIFRHKRGVKPDPHAQPALWAVAVTYLSVLVGAVFFRASSTGSALTLLGGMLGLHGSGVSPEFVAAFAAGGQTLRTQMLWPLTYLAWLAALYAIVWGLPNTQQIMRRTDPALGRILPARWPAVEWRPNWHWAVVGGATALVAILAIGGTSEFLYFQF